MYLLHVELSHDDLRQIGMEKKQEGDPSHQSKPTEGVKEPAVSGNASQFLHFTFQLVVSKIGTSFEMGLNRLEALVFINFSKTKGLLIIEVAVKVGGGAGLSK